MAHNVKIDLDQRNTPLHQKFYLQRGLGRIHWVHLF